MAMLLETPEADRFETVDSDGFASSYPAERLTGTPGELRV